MFDTKVPFCVVLLYKKTKQKKKNLFVKEDMAKKAVHVLADRNAMHIQLPNMCKDKRQCFI